jgi:hypothetical protein
VYRDTTPEERTERVRHAIQLVLAQYPPLK